MNKIFTTVWCESRQQWVVTSELTHSAGRPKLAPKKSALALLLGTMLLPSGPAMAVDYNNVTLGEGGSSNTQNVLTGDMATSTTINTSGRQSVSSGGVAIDTTINTSGWQSVYSGGSATGTTINTSGRQNVYGGTATGTMISGGFQYVDSGGTATNTTIDRGAQYVHSGGAATNTTIKLGLQQLISGGMATSTTIDGGRQRVGGAGSGTAIDTTINSGGLQEVLNGGTAIDTIINNDGQQLVSRGGTATDTIISGGMQFVSSGGTTTDTTIDGGQSWLFTGALADGKTEINAGGELLMEAGSIATDVHISGGTLSITDLSDATSSYTPAQIDNLTMNGGNVSFLRDSHGDFAGLNISELSGTGNFLFNISIAEKNSNFVTIEQGTGNFGIAVMDTGRDVASHDDLTVNLIHEKSGDAEFSLVQSNGRSITAVDGGTYMYTLHSEQDKDNLTGNVWYLAVPAKNGDGDGNIPQTTPATDAVLSMATAGLNIIRSELDALRVYRNNQSSELKHGEANVWGHYLGKKSAIDNSNGAAYKLHQNGFELGGDITTGFDRGNLVTGGYMTLSDNKVNHDRGGKSKVDSYGLGAYATWYDNSGFYVDGVVKANRLESNLNAKMTNGGATSGKWHQYGISTALEGGFTFKPMDNLTIEPFVRTTATHINNANVELSNGMKAETGKARSLTAEAGSRLGTQFSVGKTQFAPYLQLSIEQEFAKSNQTIINGVNRFDNNINGTSGKYGAGMSVRLKDNVALYGEVNYRQGSHIEEPIQGVAGIRVSF